MVRRDNGGGSTRSSRLFGVGLILALALVLAFLLIPILAIFLRISPGDLFGQLGSEVALDALIVTAKTTVIAQAIILLLGTPAAYLLATRRFRGRSVVITLIELPLVLPPAVAGIGLLAAFGRAGLLGGTIDALGFSVGFTQGAVVMAVIFVASPFYIRQGIAALESVDKDLLAASRTLGAGPGRTFRRVALPLASTGLAAGAALSFARGVAEFGATLFFAGSFEGVTQTLPLAVYAQFDVNFDVALAISALLVLISAAVLLAVKLLPAWTRSDSTSAFPFAPSSSG
jgi:molybdate transport system permease protein